MNIDHAKRQRLAIAAEQHGVLAQGHAAHVRNLAEDLRDARQSLQSPMSAHFALSTKYPHLREARSLDRENLRRVTPNDLREAGIDPAVLSRIDALTEALSVANAAAAASQAELSQRVALQQSLDQWAQAQAELAQRAVLQQSLDAYVATPSHD